MSKKAAIIQSNYIPWKGYFDMINLVDEFILFDDVQYTRRDWRNRNLIKTPQGLQWLTIPVEVKGKYFQKICETRISDPGWAKSHWERIRHVYAKAPYFKTYQDQIAALYLETREDQLSQVNYRFLQAINEILGIQTRLSFSSEYADASGKNEKLISLCKAVGATEYLSGPSAKVYIDPVLFEREGIRLSWMDYTGYPEYEQLYPPFEHGVTILDLLFHTGPEAPGYMKSFQSKFHVRIEQERSQEPVNE